MMALLLALTLLSVSPEEVRELIEQGRFDEAQKLSNSLPKEVQPRLEGLIALGRGDHAAAVQFFERALDGSPGQLELHLALAHAYLASGRPEQALAHANQAAPLGQQVIAQPLVTARAMHRLGDKEGAARVLQQARRSFTDDPRLLLELASIYSHLGLRAATRRLAEELLAHPLDQPTTLGLFHLLYRDPAALPQLEAAAVGFSQDAEVQGHLGHAYAAQQKWLAAAKLFARATSLGGDFAFEAADQYRLGGRLDDALRWNALVPQAPRRLRQRVAILFEGRHYARITALSVSDPDPATQYRLAYAHYATGRHQRAAELCRALLSTSYHDAARSLLAAMGREVQPQ